MRIHAVRWLSPLLFVALSATADPIGAGLTFVLQNRSPTGAFGEATGEDAFVATSETLTTLRVLGSATSSEAQDAELFLATATATSDVELELRRALALSSTAWSLGAATSLGSDSSDNLERAFALASLARPNAALSSDTIILAEQLAETEGLDGCFGFADNAPSVELTAEVMLALKPFSFDATVNSALLGAVGCLRAQQQPGGSFGSDAATASAILALLEAPGSHASAVALGRIVLAATQLPDGSWGESVRVTAKALRALGSAFPDWRISVDDRGSPLLSVANPAPLVGEDLAVSLDIENRAATDAPATQVAFVARPLSAGVDVPLGTAQVPALAPGGFAHVYATLPTLALNGRYNLIATVDPVGLVAEVDKTNNVASAPITVRSEVDLSVSSTSIHFTSVGAGQTRIDVDVRNLGSTLPASTDVDIYKGNPTSGGAKLGTASIPAGLATNASFTVSATWNSASANGPTPIFAVADPHGTIDEADESNNSVFRYFFPGADVPVDLSIDAADITTDPATPSVSLPFKLRATIRNLSTSDANRVQVALLNLSTGGPWVALLELSLVPAQGSAVAEFTTTLISGAVLKIIVDPQSRIADTNRYDNSAIKQVSTTQSIPYDATVMSFGASQPNAQNGAAVTLSAVVQNLGDVGFSTELRLVDLAAEGAVLTTLPVVFPARGIQTINLGTYTTPDRAMVLRACLDPFNQLAEPNENNNCAEATVGSGHTDPYILPRDIQFSPYGADVGEKVHLSATVRNKEAAAGTMVVEWWQGVPSLGASTKLGETPLAVPGSASALAEFDWVRQEGPIEVYVRLAQVSPKESQPNNNVTGRHLFLESLVDIGLPYAQSEGHEVRVGRLTGRAEPELVIGYKAVGSTSGVAVLQRGPQGYGLLWRQPVLNTITDVVLADADNDGSPEVFALSVATGTGNTPNTEIDAFRADGSLKWRNVFPVNGGVVHGALAIGDLNSDGVADIVCADSYLRAFSGDDGHLLFSSVLHADGRTGDTTTLVVLDVDGDGNNEILGSDIHQFLYDRFGNQIWMNTDLLSLSVFSVVDLDLDGYPEMVSPWGDLTALDARTGQVRQRSRGFRTWLAPPPIGQLRQDGLPYLVSSDNSYFAQAAGFTPELELLWVQSIARPDGTDVYAGALADLLGLGRPQFIANGSSHMFLFVDGRDGHLLMDIPASQLGDGTNGSGSHNYFYDRSPVVADLGSGKASVIIGRLGGTEMWSPIYPVFGHGEAVILSSPHWVHQPTVWPTRVIRKGQIDENLRVGNDYRWWTSHNTWNEQFDVEPAKTLADLKLAESDLSASPNPGVAGSTVTLSAQLRNVGGLSASNVAVALYDGEPGAGGKLLGTTQVAGPLSPRGGSMSASIDWTAYPEGEHFIYAVANSDGAIEESGTENNIASFRLFVQPGSGLCDLAIDAASLSASPASPQAGDGVTFAANVRNIGARTCGGFVLAAYDGVGAEGGPLLALVAVPALSAGDAYTASLPAKATPGSHLIRFIADEAGAALDGDRSNNAATLSLFVPPSPLADFAVGALVLSPSLAYPYEPVSGTALVKNQGAPSPSAPFTVVSNGALVAQGVVPPLASGAVATLTFGFAAPTASSVIALDVDPGHALLEFDESNNHAEGALSIQASGLVLSATAAPISAGPQTNISFSVSATLSSGAAREVFFDAQVLGPAGDVVGVVASQAREVLGASSTTTRTYGFNTGNNVAGAYRMRVSAASSGRLLAHTDAQFSIQEEKTASTALLVDRGTYSPGEQVLLNQRLTNTSRNSSLSGATLIVSVRDAAGNGLYATSRAVPTLAPSFAFDTADLFLVSPNLPPGTYSGHSAVWTSDGVQLASAASSFTIAYSAAATVTARLQVVSPFFLGPALNATVELTNSGALALGASTLELLLLDADSLATESSASRSVTVAAGQTGSFTLALATSALSEGQKLLVARLSGKTVDRQLVTAVRITDFEPPIISISGVTDLLVTKAAVSPSVTVVDQSEVAVTLELDGAPFASGTAIEGEGQHILFVRAVDYFTNTSERTVRFALDFTPPALSLSGVADGALLNGPVTLVFSATDANPGTTTSTLDGVPIDSDVTVTAEGEHVWVVQSTDAAGNASTETRAFALDFTRPLLFIAGVADGDIRNTPVTASISAADTHPKSLEATLDGQPYTSGTPIESEGQHVLAATATDGAGNTASASVSFTLDFTPPVIAIMGILEGQLSNQAPVILFEASEGTPSATLDGIPFGGGDVVSTEGPHEVVVTSVDAAGNVGTASRRFALDFTPPAISISGPVAGAWFAATVTVTFSASDINLVDVTATLDGAPLASGTVVTTEGRHTILVRARDGAGNEASGSVPFSIDVTPPVVTIGGVADGATGPQFTPTWSATDAHLDGAAATLDGTPFVSGTTVTDVGPHQLAVTAKDLAGNLASASVSFTVSVPTATRPEFHYAVCAFGRLDIASSARVDAPSGIASVAAHGDIDARNSAYVSGSAVSGGSMSLSNTAYFGGRAYYGGAFALATSAKVQGGSQKLSVPPKPCECGYDLRGQLAEAAAVNDNAKLLGEPKVAQFWVNGGLEVKSGTLVLPAGRYYLSHLSLRTKSTVSVAAGASVELYVEHAVDVENNSTLGALSAGSSMLVVSGASAANGEVVAVRNKADANLQLYAPEASVELANNSKLTGAVVGEDIRLLNNQRVALSLFTQISPPPLSCP